MRLLLAAIVGLVFTAPVMAQPINLLSLESRQDGRVWEAVGRLELANRAFCTGALISPRLVLTAAHCLFNEDGSRLSATDVQFLAGWRNGRAAAYRRVRRAVVHPDYNYLGKASAERVFYDIALLELQHPIRNTTVMPFQTDRKPGVGARVGVVSYAHNRAEAPTLQEICEVLADPAGILVMSCEVDFGSSGSPVFSFDNGDPRIVSVVSAMARSDGKPVSLGAPIEDQVATILNRMEAGEGFAAGSVFRPVRAESGIRSTTGAKFIRPPVDVKAD